MKKPSFYFLFSSLLLLFLSCASGPKVSLPSEGHEFELLPAGGNVYFWADTVKGRSLLDAVSPIDMNTRSISSTIDRMETAVAALYGETENQRFYLAANGNFPRFRADLSFSFSRGWKRQSSPGGGTYWYSQSENTAIALNSNLVRVSNADPLIVFPSEYPPQGFIEFRGNMVFAGWMTNPAETLNSFMSSLEIPLQIPAADFFFGAIQAQSDPSAWELVFSIRTSSEIQARALMALFSVARLAVLRGQTPPDIYTDDMNIGQRELALILFANPPVQNRDALVLRTNPISTGIISLLFRMFPLYSN